MIERSKKRLLVVYLLAALGLALIAGALTDWRRLYRLTKEGHKTSGWITAKEPANHRALRYRYNVGNQAYHGVETRGALKAGVRFEAIQVGDVVEVVFVPDQPDISCACNPGTLLRSELLFITTMVLLGPVAILVLSPIARRVKRKDQISSHPGHS